MVLCGLRPNSVSDKPNSSKVGSSVRPLDVRSAPKKRALANVLDYMPTTVIGRAFD
jgi:hypothetical protein